MTDQTERQHLIGQQSTVLSTTGHHDNSRCYVQLRKPFMVSGKWCPPAAFMCEEAATHWVEREDYRIGATINGEFRPAVVMTKVCTMHADLLEHEPGLLVLRRLVTS